MIVSSLNSDIPMPDLGSIKEVFDEIVEVGDEAGRSLSAIPTDNSQPGQAGFRLPISDDFEIVEVGDSDESGRSLSAIPTDNSQPGRAGFRLPKFLILFFSKQIMEDKHKHSQ